MSLCCPCVRYKPGFASAFTSLSIFKRVPWHSKRLANRSRIKMDHQNCSGHNKKNTNSQNKFLGPTWFLLIQTHGHARGGWQFTAAYFHSISRWIRLWCLHLEPWNTAIAAAYLYIKRIATFATQCFISYYFIPKHKYWYSTVFIPPDNCAKWRNKLNGFSHCLSLVNRVCSCTLGQSLNQRAMTNLPCLYETKNTFPASTSIYQPVS